MKISIIISTYYSEATIRDTFDSVLRQNYNDYEIIVVDGNSKDQTVEIIKDYEERLRIKDEGSKIRWISESDYGIYDAMNKGIRMASGDIVGILNSDDFYTSSDILLTIANAFQEHPDVDAVYGDIHFVDPADLTKYVRYYSSKTFKRSRMRYGFMPAHPSFYCRKSVYDKFALPDEETGEKKYFDISYVIAADFENLLRMIFVGKIKTMYINKDFVTMRTGGASTSGFFSHLQITKDHLRAYRKNGVFSNIIFELYRYAYKFVEIHQSKYR